MTEPEKFAFLAKLYSHLQLMAVVEAVAVVLRLEVSVPLQVVVAESLQELNSLELRALFSS